MPSNIRSAVANVAGAATVQDWAIPTGLVWVVSQVTTKVIRPSGAPVSGATCQMLQNGQPITSTANAQLSSAQGPPFLHLSSSDLFQMVFAGCALGDNCIVNLFYNEVPWTNTQLGIGIV